jgi:hypothetical protein
MRAMRESATACDCSALRAKTTSLMNDNMRLHSELRVAHETIALHRSEVANLLEERCFRERAKGLDENAKLINLHVASQRLHEGRARPEVLLAIEEIVINLIGSEELGVFELSPDRTSLVLVSSFGIDAARYATIPVGEGVIGRVAETGEAYLHLHPRDSRAEDDLTACVPLRLCGRVVGLLAIFRLLDQKPVMVDVDRAILDLVSIQAAPALYCSQLGAP